MWPNEHNAVCLELPSAAVVDLVWFGHHLGSRLSTAVVHQVVVTQGTAFRSHRVQRRGSPTVESGGRTQHAEGEKSYLVLRSIGDVVILRAQRTVPRCGSNS